MNMKNVRYIFCALALIMGTTGVFANKINDNYNFSANSQGGNRVQFKLLVRSSDRDDNYYYGLDMDKTIINRKLSYDDLSKTSYLYYKEKGSDTKHILLYYGTFDRAFAGEESNESQVCVDAGNKGWMVVTKPNGTTQEVGRFIIESILSKDYDYVNWASLGHVYQQSAANGFTQHAVSCDHPVGYADDKYLEGIWEMPSSLADKEIELWMHGAYYDMGDSFQDVCEHFLGTFLTNSDPSPTLADPFYYPTDENGNQLVGKIAAIFCSMQEMTSYTVHYGDTSFTKAATGYAGTVVVDANDTITGLYMDITSYYSLSEASQSGERQTQTHKTISVAVKPLHKIYDFHVEPCTDASGEDRNYNKLSWTIRHSNLQDIGAGDVFIIQRATKPDFSDAEELPMLYTLPYTTGQDTTLTYIDNTFNAPLPEDGKLYYRITRGYAAVWDWSEEAYQKNYCAKDSVGNHAFLWSLYSNPETDIPTIKTEIVSGTSAMVQVNLCSNEDGNNLINYVWDKQAQLVLIRHNLTLDETTEINLFNRPEATMTNCRDDANQQLLWSYKILDAGLYPCCQYTFSVRIDTADCVIHPRTNATLAYTDTTVYSTEDVPVVITGFAAAKDESKDFVLLSWQNDPASVDTFFIDCRANGASQWTPVAKVTDNNYYEDYNTVPGIHYEYRLSATYTCYNESKDAVCAVDSGWLDPYGSISGIVMMPNGTGIGSVKVVITDENGKTYTTTTNSDGSYTCDELIYDAAGTNFSISVEDTFGGGTYISATTELPTMNVTLKAHDAEKANYVFRPSKFYTITGRVLYENTSVPVAYAEFAAKFGKTAPENTMKNASGEPVRTDLNGYFTLQVPTSITSLRVYKQNHTFAAGGYLTVDGKTDLALSDDLREIRFYDKTKAHVLGRVSAGLMESVYALGTDSSTNRLGDDITLVLELEGDNISQLVNDPNDLSRATMDTIIVHTHAKEIKGTDHVFQTEQYTTRKRVTIHADNMSGEFRAELLPVRYKVVQMYANGYATLLDPDQAMPVLDLTESILSPYEYNYVYHSEPVIAYKQMTYGMMLPYCGEGDIVVVDMENKADLVKLVTLPEKAMKKCNTVSEQVDSVSYLYGYPVFVQKTYSMRVGVYEPYYYNNDPKAHDLYSVPLQGELKVYNNMASSMETSTYKLNAKGEASFNFACNNTTFTLTGENALRTLEMSFDYNGKHVQSAQLQGYVMGSKDIDGGVMQKLGTSLVLDDVLRDPYGAGSYATLEKGTSYYTYYHKNTNYTEGATLTFESQQKITLNLLIGGIGSGKIMKALSGMEFPWSISILLAVEWDNKYHYSYTTTSAISTSAGNRREDIGAEADVYIGHTDEIGYVKKMAIQIVDSLYAASHASQFGKGNAHIIAQGRDTLGQLHYLMVTEVIAPKQGEQHTQFAYSQNHILKTIIPDLERKRNDLLVHISAAEDTVLLVHQLLERANQTGEVQYLSSVPESHKYFGKDGYYVAIYPDRDKIKGALMDEVEQYNNLITEWENMIKTNERLKANITYSGDIVETYSLSGGTSADYSESAMAEHDHYFKWDFQFPTAKKDAQMDQILKQLNLNGNAGGVSKSEAKQRSTVVDTDYGAFDWSIAPSLGAPTYKVDYSANETATRTVSYHLGADNYATNNQTVYRVTNDSWKDTQLEDWWDNAYYRCMTKPIVAESLYEDKEKADSPVNDFVFVQNGGATACPWEGADSAHFLLNTQLSAPTLKLDNPTIALDRHEQSDIPADEAAIFTVTLANESEQMTNKIGTFILMVNDETNPNGLSVLVDGQPLGNGREFYIQAGSSITKVIEVRRGNGYDFENVELKLVSDCDVKLTDAVTFSVHYTPVASPVTISAPDDKWVLNTLSNQDADGYYLPVTISGFDINYDNFDHIEFQYKLSNEGESKWVNLCSYYANDSLYQIATGSRELMKSTGKIENIRFYGERDPMEQHYDLRAVSYSRYGNGYITRTSPVVSGTKDTRVPDVFGKTSPTSGILTYEDDIRINFTENIAGQYLDKDNNFQVLGAVNSTSMETGTSLFFPGTDETYAVSRTTRSVNGTNFTVDMMVQVEDEVENGQLFTIYDENNNTANVTFGVAKNKANERVLYATIDGTTYYSQALPATLRNFQRVALEYELTEDGHEISFRENTVHLGEDVSMRATSTESSTIKRGTIVLGANFKGRMMEARLWNKVLSQDEYGSTQSVRLTGYEHGLLAYWPMNEGGTANVSQDKAHGNHLDLRGLSWQMPEGCSLRFTAQTANDSVVLNDKFVANTGASDYTIMFWWKSEQAADTVALFATGRGTKETSGLFIGMEHGRIVVQGNGTKLSSANATDDKNWHHFTMTVNRSQNLVNVYVDEQLVAQNSATDFPGISGTPFLGRCSWVKVVEDRIVPCDSYPFVGHLDFFSLWNSALPLDFIAHYAQHAPSGEEIALQAYLQLHRRHLNPNGIYEIAPSIFNEVCKRDEATGKIAVEANMNKDTLLFCNANLLAAMWDKEDYAPVQEASPMGKLNYQYKAKDDQLLIELTDPEKQINKQQVYISVREVEDLNGNPIASTVTVPVYVDLNRIRWSDYSIERTINLAEEDAFTATIINRCGSNKQYTITTDADWLECSSTMGQLSPKEERTITFTVSDGLNPGEYSTIAYITDEMDLSEPLLVNVIVLANEPTWNIDKSDKDVTASLYGQVKLKQSDGNYVYDMDERDVIGAFVGPECIGKAHVKTDNQGHSDLFITMYGNENIQGKIVSFSLWRATSGVTYKLVTESDLYYQSGGCYGCEGTPVIFSTSEEECMQLFSLNKGWNWISTYLNLAPNATLENTLLKSRSFQVGDEIKTSHDKVSAQFVNQPYSDWAYTNGDKMTLDEQNVYAVKSSNGTAIAWVGGALPDSLRKVTINAGGAWSQLPYLCETTQSVTNALTSYFQSATAGDIVKGYDQFAIFTADKRWVGSLEYMRPGQGYFIKSASIYPVTITYVNNDNLYRVARRAKAEDKAQSAYESAVTRGQYNMPIVAAAEGVELEQGDLLRAFSDDVCVGEAVMTNDSLFFISVYDGTTNDLSFEIVRNGVKMAKSSKKAKLFSPNGSLGTYENPYVIDFVQKEDSAKKLMINGRLYIRLNDKTYNAQGALVNE